MNYGYSKSFAKGTPEYKRAKKQRKNRGFDDTELASLDVSLARHILPRLKRFYKKNACHPVHFTQAQWNLILEDMIFAFEYIVDDSKYIGINPSNPEVTRMARGLELFGKYYTYLWI